MQATRRYLSPAAYSRKIEYSTAAGSNDLLSPALRLIGCRIGLPGDGELEGVSRSEEIRDQRQGRIQRKHEVQCVVDEEHGDQQRLNRYVRGDQRGDRACGLLFLARNLGITPVVAGMYKTSALISVQAR